MAALLVTTSATTTVSSQETTAQTVTVNFLTQGEPDTLDPNRVSFARAADAAVIRQVFEPLLRFDDRLIPQPAAAESYDVSPDGTLYTFHLRQDGRWSDGQPVTAGEFEYSWKRLLDPALHADYAPLFVDAGIVGADDYHAGRTQTPDRVGISSLDGDTLQVRLDRPFGAFPDLAALWPGVPLRPDIVAEEPDSWASDPATYVGNGAFMLSEWAHQDHLTLTPNPRYTAHARWPKPTLTRVTLLMGTNPEADFVGFRTNVRDWALVPDAELNAALSDPDLAGQTRQYNELTTFWLQMNQARPPLNNVLVRRALARAIDRTAMVRDLATSVNMPITTLIPPGMPGFAQGLGQDLSFDAASARALLAQAGFDAAHAFPNVSFSYADTAANLRRAQYVQAQWRDHLGIEVALKPVDASAYQQAIDARDFDLTFGGWSADYPDPRDWFGLLFGCKAPYNRVNYCSPAFDQVVARADSGTSMPERLQLYDQAQSLLTQDVAVAPLFVRGRLALVKPWVQSVDGGPLPISPLDEYPGSLFLDFVRVQILPH